MPNTFLKDPDATLDYQWDWAASTNSTGDTDWLASGETISSFTLTVPTGISVSTSSESSGAVTVYLSGGTAGSDYDVACKITTSVGRIDERTITLKVRDR